MTDPSASRVRVTGPDLRFRPLARTDDIDEQTPLGDVYVRSLLRAQLSLALGVIAVLLLTVGSLPALFFVFPELGQVDVAGIPMAWVILGGLVYPWLLALGWVYVRRAERNERHFAELVGLRGADATPEPEPAPDP